MKFEQSVETMKEERDERECYERGMRGVGKRVL